MKIKPEHIDHIRRAILAKYTRANLEHFAARYAALGRSEERLRWDLTYSTQLSQWIADTIYTYADDSHLDTALRHIMRQVLA